MKKLYFLAYIKLQNISLPNPVDILCELCSCFLHFHQIDSGFNRHLFIVKLKLELYRENSYS